MQVFHANPDHASAKRCTRALDRLREQLQALQVREIGDEDFERIEGEIHALFTETEREVLGAQLERLDVDMPFVVIDGRRHHCVFEGPKRYMTAAGPVSVKRRLYRCSADRAVVPVELRAGIIDGYWTPLAARQASYLVAHVTPQEGESVLRELGNMAPSKSSLDRLPKYLSAGWEARREQFEASLRAAYEVPEAAVSMAVSLDGVMVAMKDGEREAKRTHSRAAGKSTKGPAGYQEVGCATVSFYDAEGARLDTVRMGRMPESKKATLKTMLRMEVESMLRQCPELTVVKVADGARDNWSYLDALVPEGTAVVDFYHAAQQLKAALDAAYGESSAKGQAQFSKLRHVLIEDGDGVERVIRALAYLRTIHPRKRRIGEVLRYFRRNRHRMRYYETKVQNLPIGSGVVEAACKTLVTQRLKRSGMRWRHEGGQAILTFRAITQSNRFDQAWALLSSAYRRPVTIAHNVFEFPRKRAA